MTFHREEKFLVTLKYRSLHFLPEILKDFFLIQEIIFLMYDHNVLTGRPERNPPNQTARPGKESQSGRRQETGFPGKIYRVSKNPA